MRREPRRAIRPSRRLGAARSRDTGGVGGATFCVLPTRSPVVLGMGEMRPGGVPNGSGGAPGRALCVRHLAVAGGDGTRPGGGTSLSELHPHQDAWASRYTLARPAHSP
jgi:hypothetical protein